MVWLVASIVAMGAVFVNAQDWPQWRGANRDARAADFKAPNTWPKELTRKWTIPVGEGVASPAVIGDRVYVFSRQDNSEVTRCLAAADGKEIWLDKYESLGASGPAQGFSGPRSSPAVANGKVVTLGVRGMISALDAANGTKLWRKDDFQAYPNFHPSSSPLIADGLAIAQLGGRDNGALVAYDLTSGEQKWKCSGPCPSYASPALLTVAGATLVIAQTEAKLIGVKAADGSLAWESAPAQGGGGPGGGGPGGGGGRGMGGGGRDYRASSPVVDGQTVIVAGRGVRAIKIEKEGDKFVDRELWNNPDKGAQFNTPVLKNGMLYGLTANNELYCLDAKDGKALWNVPFPGTAAPAGGPPPRAELDPNRSTVNRPGSTAFGLAEPQPSGRPGERGGPGGGGRRGGGMGGGAGYGSVVDAGAVLLALTPAGQLVVFEPSATEFKQLTTYKVAEGQTYAYPVASGNRIFIKDKESLTLWTVE